MKNINLGVLENSIKSFIKKIGIKFYNNQITWNGIIHKMRNNLHFLKCWVNLRQSNTSLSLLCISSFGLTFI